MKSDTTHLKQKTPLVFLHGWKQDKQTWNTVISHLEAEFACYAPDLPGFGARPKPENSWSIPQYAEWVQQYCNEHSIKNPVLIGHSFGGRVAIVLATEMKLSGLVLYATPGLPQPLSRFTSLAQALHHALKKTAIPFDKTKTFKKIRDRFRSADYLESDQLQQIFLNVVNFDLTPYFDQITASTLLLWGEKDTEVPLTVARAMEQMIPETRLQIIPHASHFAHRENPSLFAGIIRNFVGNHHG